MRKTIEKNVFASDLQPYATNLQLKTHTNIPYYYYYALQKRYNCTAHLSKCVLRGLFLSKALIG